MVKIGRAAAAVAVGGSLGAAGVMGARAAMPTLMGMFQKIPFIGPKLAASPGAQQFLSDMTVAFFAAPGVVAGVAVAKGKSVSTAAKEAVAVATPAKA